MGYNTESRLFVVSYIATRCIHGWVPHVMDEIRFGIEAFRAYWALQGRFPALCDAHMPANPVTELSPCMCLTSETSFRMSPYTTSAVFVRKSRSGVRTLAVSAYVPSGRVSCSVCEVRECMWPGGMQGATVQQQLATV